jgi:hypothetical protein
MIRRFAIYPHALEKKQKTIPLALRRLPLAAVSKGRHPSALP